VFAHLSTGDEEVKASRRSHGSEKIRGIAKFRRRV